MSETMRLKDISETELELLICRKLLGIVEARNYWEFLVGTGGKRELWDRY